jgi:hypothetical protein
MRFLALTAALLSLISAAHADDKAQSELKKFAKGHGGGDVQAAPAAAAAPVGCGPNQNYTPGPGARTDFPVCADWGQSKPEVLGAVYGKLLQANKDDIGDQEGLWTKLWHTKPKIETVPAYLPSDSPAVFDSKSDEDAHISVGQSALDLAQNEHELAGLVGHELWHTRRKKWSHDCFTRGFHKAKQSRPSLPGSTFMEGKECTECKKVKPFQRDLEREADCHGAKLSAKAGFNPQGAREAIKHVKDLGEALGAVFEADEDHPSFDQRDKDLAECISNKQLFTAQCPWGEKDD